MLEYYEKMWKYKSEKMDFKVKKGKFVNEDEL
jgi:hypothetical protein